MLRPRIIPSLLLNWDHLVKTIRFKDEKYIGDPINAVKIFNEKEADEIIIIDHKASIENRDPNFALLKDIAGESRMPMCYGGGIKSLEQAERLINFGIEKIAISSSFFLDKNLCKKLINTLGSQSVVVILDVKKNIFGKYNLFINGGRKKIDISLGEAIDSINEIESGEILINSIDNDGVMKGYDIDLAKLCFSKTKVPITFLGGAGRYEHISDLLNQTGIVGCSAGSLFVFKGKYRAVLISYPNENEKKEILK